MSLTETEQLLLDQVRAGDHAGWDQLVDRFQGRLLAFARNQLPQPADAEDTVQETFVSLLQSLDHFRGKASLETWLFQLLRRRIADHHRRASRGVRIVLCSLSGSLGAADEASSVSVSTTTDQSASWYVRREEQAENDLQELTRAVRVVTERLKEQQKFRDLIAFDLLFFAQQRNQEIAAELDMTEAAVALLKHRFVRRVAAEAPDLPQDDPDQFVSGELLSQIWEEGRPSCPKRSTLGKFVLGTLDVEWDRYVDFHVDRLGCHYCGANRPLKYGGIGRSALSRVFLFGGSGFVIRMASQASESLQNAESD